MVYETDFYTTRRPYSSRVSPSLSTYTITSEPSRQVRVLPGLGKVHVVHTYDRIIPYVGHKRLTVVTNPPVSIRVRPSTLYREFDRIENKMRPITYGSYTNDYLNSSSHVTFDDETRLIRAQTASLLQRIHDPVPRRVRPMPLPYTSRFEEVPARLMSDNYIHRLILSTPSNKAQYTQYATDPYKKYFGQGHLACVTFAGEKTHPRRRNVYVYQDPVRNDIQLLSYYINRFREEKALKPKAVKAESVEEKPEKPQAEISE